MQSLDLSETVILKRIYNSIERTYKVFRKTFHSDENHFAEIKRFKFGSLNFLVKFGRKYLDKTNVEFSIRTKTIVS